MEKLPQTQPTIDLELTTAVTTPDGKHLFAEGIIIRKISKFVINGKEDGFLYGSFKSFKVSSLPDNFKNYNRDFIKNEITKMQNAQSTIKT